MLDEPLGSLDRSLRERLMVELPLMLRTAGVAAIVVTHDQEEAFSIADRVVLMRDGAVVQTGTPEHVYRRPAVAWAARFLGLDNLVAGRMQGPDLIATALGDLRVGTVVDKAVAPRSDVLLLVRPEAARLDDQGANTIRGEVLSRTFRGLHHRLVVGCSGGVEMTFAVMSLPRSLQAGDAVTVSLDPDAMVVLPAE
jgi:thiamine transport system ATP-binding protein